MLEIWPKQIVEDFGKGGGRGGVICFVLELLSGLNTLIFKMF